MRNSQQMPKPNLQQTPNPKCPKTITDQTNNNNKPCNPNQRTQLNPSPTNISFSKSRSNQPYQTHQWLLIKAEEKAQILANPVEPSTHHHLFL